MGACVWAHAFLEGRVVDRTTRFLARVDADLPTLADDAARRTRAADHHRPSAAKADRSQRPVLKVGAFEHRKGAGREANSQAGNGQSRPQFRPSGRPKSRVASNLLAASREIAHMSAIADLFRLLESHFNSLTPAVQGVLLLIGIYSLSFLVIRFVIFICCKWKSDGLSNASATALAMLLATLLWPAFIAIWAALYSRRGESP